MSSKVGIKVPVDSSVVKVVKTVKDIEPLLISEIKRRLNDSDYLLTYRVLRGTTWTDGYRKGRYL